MVNFFFFFFFHFFPIFPFCSVCLFGFSLGYQIEPRQIFGRQRSLDSVKHGDLTSNWKEEPTQGTPNEFQPEELISASQLEH